MLAREKSWARQAWPGPHTQLPLVTKVANQQPCVAMWGSHLEQGGTWLLSML